VALGAALAAVGWVDLALLWYPIHFGTLEWEFGTASSLFDGLALGTVGLGALALGALGRDWRSLGRWLAIVCIVIAIALLAVYGLYWRDSALVQQYAPPESRPILRKAVLKATLFAAIYVALYAWLGSYLWVKTRASK